MASSRALGLCNKKEHVIELVCTEEKQKRCAHFSKTPAMKPLFHIQQLFFYVLVHLPTLLLSIKPPTYEIGDISQLSQAQASDDLLAKVSKEAVVGGQYTRKKKSQKILCLWDLNNPKSLI